MNMSWFLPERLSYSRAEYLSDAAVHIVGLAIALWAVPLLVMRAMSAGGDRAAVLGTSIYGTTLIAMILCSALYNMAPEGTWTRVLQRLDHSAIYFKIAGTYTPFTLLSGHGMLLLTGVWGAALAGTGLRVFAPERTRTAAITLYILMGWAGFVAGQSVFAELSPHTLGLVVIGGLVYSAGLVFYFVNRLPFHNTIWHIFVLAGSVVFFVAISGHVAETSLLRAGA